MTDQQMIQHLERDLRVANLVIEGQSLDLQLHSERIEHLEDSNGTLVAMLSVCLDSLRRMTIWRDQNQEVIDHWRGLKRGRWTRQ